MAETESVEDLAELYDSLKNNAKSMVMDLREGVGMYRYAASLFLYISFLGFFLLYLNNNPPPPPAWSKDTTDVLALLLAFAGIGAGLYVRRQYTRLRKKYSKLFETADKVK